MLIFPFQQSSEAPLILVSVAWCLSIVILSRSALGLLFICDAYYLLIVVIVLVASGRIYTDFGSFSIQVVTRGRGYKSTYSMC